MYERLFRNTAMRDLFNQSHHGAVGSQPRALADAILADLGEALARQLTDDQRARFTFIDIGGGYRITPRMNFFFSARNIFNEPYLIMERQGANPAALQFYEVNGINWTFGVKGTF